MIHYLTNPAALANILRSRRGDITAHSFYEDWWPHQGRKLERGQSRYVYDRGYNFLCGVLSKAEVEHHFTRTDPSSEISTKHLRTEPFKLSLEPVLDAEQRAIIGQILTILEKILDRL